jgi:hypothetical protein
MKHNISTYFYTRIFAFAYMLLCLVLFSSCSGQIVVWNMKDIIGLIIFGVIILIAVFAWIIDTIKTWKRKRKMN